MEENPRKKTWRKKLHKSKTLCQDLPQLKQLSQMYTRSLNMDDKKLPSIILYTAELTPS